MGSPLETPNYIETKTIWKVLMLSQKSPTLFWGAKESYIVIFHSLHNAEKM